MAHQHSRRPGGSSHHQYPEQSKTEEDVVIVGHRSGVYEPKHVYSRQPTFSTPTLSMSVQLPDPHFDQMAHGSVDSMHHGQGQSRAPPGHSVTLSSSLPSTGIYMGAHHKSGFTSTPRSGLMHLAGSGSTLNKSSTTTPASTSSANSLLPPRSPYDQHQLQFQQQHHHNPLEWSYAHQNQTYSPFPSMTSGHLLENVSPTVDTSAFLLSPASAGETKTLEANPHGAAATTSTITLNSTGTPQLTGNHHGGGGHFDGFHLFRPDASLPTGDVMMDGLSPNPPAFRGLGLEHDDLGLGSMPTMMMGNPYDSTLGIGIEASGSNWQSSGSNSFVSSDNGDQLLHAPSYHQDPQHQHQQAQYHFQQFPHHGSFPTDFGGDGQDYSHYHAQQAYTYLPVPDAGVQIQSSRSPQMATHQVQGTEQQSAFAHPTQPQLPSQHDLNPPLHHVPPPTDRAPEQPTPQLPQPAESRPLFPIQGTTIDPATAFTVQGYLSAANRYAFGERKLVIHSPRVAQKSYGTEKRFICPPPVAVLHGRTWWTKKSNTLHSAPVINISITDEARAPDVRSSWHTTSNRYLEEPIDFGFPNGEAAFIGKACGKALHISDTPARKAKASVQAMITIMSAAGESSGSTGPRPVIGTFESKPITIVSKPSKKRQNTKNSELFLQHGTPVSLYNRIRSQTSSTKFLSVATDITRHLGSDGKAIPTHSGMKRTDPAFVADQASWDPLLIWLVDPQAHDRPPVPVSGREAWDGYPPPADVIKPPDNVPVPVICYNNTIRLQCPATGLTSPMLVVRRVDNGTTAYGGEAVRRDGYQGKCAPGELPGEPVSQLHKIALELYALPNIPNLPVYGQDFRYSGQWMTAEKDRIEYRLGKTARTMAPENAPPTPRSRPGSASSLPSSPNIHLTGLKPLTSRATGPVTPTTMTTTLPNTFGSNGQEFLGGGLARQPSMTQGFGSAGTPYGVSESPSRENRTETSGPGPTRRRRTSSNASVSSRNTLGLSSSMKSSTMSPPAPPKPMRTISGEASPSSEATRWFVELAETATWTIVGAETKVYTFWVNPDLQIESPVTPLPSAEQCAQPGQTIDTGRRHIVTTSSMSTLPQATLYGGGFTKDHEGNPTYTVWWGTEPAEENEFKCPEVMCASVPRTPPARSGRPNNRLPICLVRQDGMVAVPTGLTWTR